MEKNGKCFSTKQNRKKKNHLDKNVLRIRSKKNKIKLLTPTHTQLTLFESHKNTTTNKTVMCVQVGL